MFKSRHKGPREVVNAELSAKTKNWQFIKIVFYKVLYKYCMVAILTSMFLGSMWILSVFAIDAKFFEFYFTVHIIDISYKFGQLQNSLSSK